MNTATEPKSAKRPRKMARRAKPESAAINAAIVATEVAPTAPTPSAAKPQSKVNMVLDLLRRPTGASIDDLVAATGWLPHTTRAALTGLKKKGHVLISEKVEGKRCYRVEVPAA